MLPSKERILKRNDGFRELVLSCFGSCVEQELARVKPLLIQAETEAQDENITEEEKYTLPDYELRLYNWIKKQLKNSDIINPSSPLQAKPQFIEAVLAMFDDTAGDDIKYAEITEGGKIDLDNYVDWDLSKPIIMNKIISSEYLYGLAL